MSTGDGSAQALNRLRRRARELEVELASMRWDIPRGGVPLDIGHQDLYTQVSTDD